MISEERLKEIYDGWIAHHGLHKLRKTFPFFRNLKDLYDWFADVCTKKDLDPQEFDFEAYVDPLLSIDENKSVLASIITAPPGEEMYEQWYETAKAEIEKQAREAGLFEQYETDIGKLEREVRKYKKRFEEAQQLRTKYEREAERLKQEKEALEKKVVPIKIKFLKAFDYGIMHYRAGDVIETRDLDWALNLIEQGIAERPAVEVPIRIGKELTKEEIKRLEDEFKATLMSELGHIPRDVMAEFRVTLIKVETLPFEEALKEIIEKAREIATRETLRRRAPVPIPRVIRPPRPEEEEPILVVARVPPAAVPEAPISPLPFPRAPSSEEKKALWDAFAYRLQEIGMSYWDFARLFKERIDETTFRSWDDLVRRYEYLVESIITGKELPPLFVWKGVPIPYGLEGILSEEEEERRKELICHFTSNVISNARYVGQKPSLAELRKKLEEVGIPHVTFDEIKEALKEGYEKRTTDDRYLVWFTNITLEDLEKFLET